MDIMDYLKLECCEIDLEAKNKDEVLLELAKLMKKSEALEDIEKEKIYKGLKKREKSGSTGFKNHIAIPHCQIDGIDNFAVGLAIFKKGVDFNSMDNKKSKIFGIIVGPKTNQKTHLKLLALISNTLKNESNKEELINSTTKIEFYENFLKDSTPTDIDYSKKGEDKLMILVVQEEELLKNITEIFLQYDISEASIIESKQMENLLSDIPLFMGFFDFTGGKKYYNNTIFAKINENKIKAFLKSVEEVVGDLSTYRGLAIYIIDLAYSKGAI